MARKSNKTSKSNKFKKPKNKSSETLPETSTKSFEQKASVSRNIDVMIEAEAAIKDLHTKLQAAKTFLKTELLNNNDFDNKANEFEQQAGQLLDIFEALLDIYAKESCNYFCEKIFNLLCQYRNTFFSILRLHGNEIFDVKKRHILKATELLCRALKIYDIDEFNLHSFTVVSELLWFYIRALKHYTDKATLEIKTLLLNKSKQLVDNIQFNVSKFYHSINDDRLIFQLKIYDFKLAILACFDTLNSEDFLSVFAQILLDLNQVNSSAEYHVSKLKESGRTFLEGLSRILHASNQNFDSLYAKLNEIFDGLFKLIDNPAYHLSATRLLLTSLYESEKIISNTINRNEKFKINILNIINNIVESIFNSKKIALIEFFHAKLPQFHAVKLLAFFINKINFGEKQNYFTNGFMLYMATSYLGSVAFNEQNGIKEPDEGFINYLKKLITPKQTVFKKSVLSVLSDNSKKEEFLKNILGVASELVKVNVFVNLVNYYRWLSEWIDWGSFADVRPSRDINSNALILYEKINKVTSKFSNLLSLPLGYERSETTYKFYLVLRLIMMHQLLLFLKNTFPMIEKFQSEQMVAELANKITQSTSIINEYFHRIGKNSEAVIKSRHKILKINPSKQINSIRDVIQFAHTQLCFKTGWWEALNLRNYYQYLKNYLTPDNQVAWKKVTDLGAYKQTVEENKEQCTNKVVLLLNDSGRDVCVTSNTNKSENDSVQDVLKILDGIDLSINMYELSNYSRLSEIKESWFELLTSALFNEHIAKEENLLIVLQIISIVAASEKQPIFLERLFYKLYAQKNKLKISQEIKNEISSIVNFNYQNLTVLSNYDLVLKEIWTVFELSMRVELTILILGDEIKLAADKLLKYLSNVSESAVLIKRMNIDFQLSHIFSFDGLIDRILTVKAILTEKYLEELLQTIDELSTSGISTLLFYSMHLMVAHYGLLHGSDEIKNAVKIKLQKLFSDKYDLLHYVLARNILSQNFPCPHWNIMIHLHELFPTMPFHYVLDFYKLSEQIFIEDISDGQFNKKLSEAYVANKKLIKRYPETTKQISYIVEQGLNSINKINDLTDSIGFNILPHIIFKESPVIKLLENQLKKQLITYEKLKQIPGDRLKNIKPFVELLCNYLAQTNSNNTKNYLMLPNNFNQNVFSVRLINALADILANSKINLSSEQIDFTIKQISKIIIDASVQGELITYLKSSDLQAKFINVEIIESEKFNRLALFWLLCVRFCHDILDDKQLIAVTLQLGEIVKDVLDKYPTSNMNTQNKLHENSCNQQLVNLLGKMFDLLDIYDKLKNFAASDDLSVLKAIFVEDRNNIIFLKSHYANYYQAYIKSFIRIAENVLNIFNLEKQNLSADFEIEKLPQAIADLYSLLTIGECLAVNDENSGVFGILLDRIRLNYKNTKNHWLESTENLVFQVELSSTIGNWPSNKKKLLSLIIQIKDVAAVTEENALFNTLILKIQALLTERPQQLIEPVKNALMQLRSCFNLKEYLSSSHAFSVNLFESLGLKKFINPNVLLDAIELLDTQLQQYEPFLREYSPELLQESKLAIDNYTKLAAACSNLVEKTKSDCEQMLVKLSNIETTQLSILMEINKGILPKVGTHKKLLKLKIESPISVGHANFLQESDSDFYNNYLHLWQDLNQAITSNDAKINAYLTIINNFKKIEQTLKTYTTDEINAFQTIRPRFYVDNEVTIGLLEDSGFIRNSEKLLNFLKCLAQLTQYEFELLALNATFNLHALIDESRYQGYKKILDSWQQAGKELSLCFASYLEVNKDLMKKDIFVNDNNSVAITIDMLEQFPNILRARCLLEFTAAEKAIVALVNPELNTEIERQHDYFDRYIQLCATYLQNADIFLTLENKDLHQEKSNYHVNKTLSRYYALCKDILKLMDNYPQLSRQQIANNAQVDELYHHLKTLLGKLNQALEKVSKPSGGRKYLLRSATLATVHSFFKPESVKPNVSSGKLTHATHLRTKSI